MPFRVALLVAVCGLIPPAASAQHFGKNKVEYVDFDFKVFETEHFDVYYYPSEEAGARIVARLAERWYARLSRVLEHDLGGRQPLILYGSQPEFAQTNVVGGFLGEGIGGVTESARRRIVMPFAPSLAETERILGHELTHAFQFDMARRYRGGTSWPLWAIEGLAQYLAVGAADPDTAMWLRDAVRSDLLPEREGEAARKFSPYRYGHAFWAYLAGRFGDRVIPQILKASKSSRLPRRIEAVTGFELQALFADWRQAAHARYGADPHVSPHDGAVSLRAANRRGRLYLGPSLSPDGRQAVFFSERDRLSLDLFLADTATGAIVRKLATTAAAIRYESLQAIRSAGSWSPEGDRFVFAAIERGQPSLVVLEMARPGSRREISLPQFGQILTPSWSPDGRAIAFSALEGGLTDLYVYELGSGALRRITDDPYADLQPHWSPDGQRLVFVTDRFSTDLSVLRFGVNELALADIRSGAVEPLPGLVSAGHLNPQWSPDGENIYFVSDPNGVSNIFRLDLRAGGVYQVTNVGGVSGLTRTSPAMSVARSAPVVAYTVYRNGRYDLEVRRGASALAGHPSGAGSAADVPSLPPIERTRDLVEQVLDEASFGLPDVDALRARAYHPGFFLEALGTPYVSSGGGPLGTFVRGGGSLLFSDLLGERKLAVFAQAGNRLRDLAVRVQFINRERRLNWGGVAEVQPSLRRLPRVWSDPAETNPTLTRETHYFDRTQVRLAGLVAYPLDGARRFELEAGVRHSLYRRTVSSIVRSIEDGRVLSRSVNDVFGGAPATMGEVSAAYVYDTAVFGPTSPVLGARSRIEATSTFGDLSAARVLLDHRRYLMPVKPYTIALRAVHLGQYGPDADDVRLLPAFLGSRQFLRGYGWGDIRCELNARGECAGYDAMLGSRLLVGNLELRAPLLGMRTRELRYGPVPVEGFLFADAGLVWSRVPVFPHAPAARHLVRSFGFGVRVNGFGFPIELAAVRATDPPSPGWSFDFTFRSGF
jgi:hypothetical protein